VLGLPRIKLYKDKDGKVQGDALIVYWKEESVPLAVTMLDETQFCYRDGRVGPQIHVEKASFSQPKEDSKAEEETDATEESHEEKVLKKRKIEKLKQ
jgi:HIV Tat-specific factor 1